MCHSNKKPKLNTREGLVIFYKKYGVFLEESTINKIYLKLSAEPLYYSAMFEYLISYIPLEKPDVATFKQNTMDFTIDIIYNRAYEKGKIDEQTARDLSLSVDMQLEHLSPEGIDEIWDTLKSNTFPPKHFRLNYEAVATMLLKMSIMVYSNPHKIKKFSKIIDRCLKENGLALM